VLRRPLLIVGFAVAGLSLPAANASALRPTDPQAAQQQPLRIMKVRQAVAAAGHLANVNVLVADTGLDLTHPDIAPRLFSLPSAVQAPNPDGLADPGTVAAGAPGWDLLGSLQPSDLAGDPDPSDPPTGSGHGTGVAGLLGAAWDNGIGGAGVAPNARFVALRTCWDDDQCYQYVQAAAFDWAAARKVRVVSMSWLVGDPEQEFGASIRAAKRTLFVAIPSGPEPGSSIDGEGESRAPCTLKHASNVLCVTTSGPDNRPSCGAYGRKSVDVAVPVENSITTLNGGGFGPTFCATSFAAPTAAGVATILFGAEPKAKPRQVRDAIIDSAHRVRAWKNKTVSGGIINAKAALKLLQRRLRHPHHHH
jgi:subtilisin family serine protease